MRIHHLVRQFQNARAIGIDHIQACPDPLAQIQLAFHELIHAIDHQYSVGLTEQGVHSLGHAIAATLWDNMDWWILMGLCQHPQGTYTEEDNAK